MPSDRAIAQAFREQSRGGECGVVGTIDPLDVEARAAELDAQQRGEGEWSRAGLLWNGMWRMFNHGNDGNSVSAQCEVQMIETFLAGGDVPAWHHPSAPTPAADVARELPEPMVYDQKTRLELFDVHQMWAFYQKGREDAITSGAGNGVDRLVNDLYLIASQGETPDGDGVTLNVQLWAEKWTAALRGQA